MQITQYCLLVKNIECLCQSIGALPHARTATGVRVEHVASSCSGFGGVTLAVSRILNVKSYILEYLGYINCNCENDDCIIVSHDF